jgi:hypothetical protein
MSDSAAKSALSKEDFESRIAAIERALSSKHADLEKTVKIHALFGALFGIFASLSILALMLLKPDTRFYMEFWERFFGVENYNYKGLFIFLLIFAAFCVTFAVIAYFTAGNPRSLTLYGCAAFGFMALAPAVPVIISVIVYCELQSARLFPRIREPGPVFMLANIFGLVSLAAYYVIIVTSTDYTYSYSVDLPVTIMSVLMTLFNMAAIALFFFKSDETSGRAGLGIIIGKFTWFAGAAMFVVFFCICAAATAFVFDTLVFIGIGTALIAVTTTGNLTQTGGRAYAKWKRAAELEISRMRQEIANIEADESAKTNPQAT